MTIHQFIKKRPYLIWYVKDFGLVGGTAISFHLGHRRSIDFDFFTADFLENQTILRKISKFQKIDKIIGKEFNEKLFRTQLAYFADVNYSEEIIFMSGFEVNDEKIKQELIEFSLA